MLSLTKNFGFPILAALAVLVVASSAHSAIQTDTASMSAGLSWTTSQLNGCGASASEPEAVPSTSPAVETIYSPDLNSNSVPGSMGGQNSTQTQSSGGVAFLPSQIEQLTQHLSVPVIARLSLVVATWRGDAPLDPPKIII